MTCSRLLIAPLLFMAFTTLEAKPQTNKEISQIQTGKASFYAGRWIGKKTASGEIYQAHHLTAAHRSLPFGTIVNVTNLKNGKSVQVRINNRGPYIKGRIIDLSLRAAKQVEMQKSGVVPVQIAIVPKLLAKN